MAHDQVNNLIVLWIFTLLSALAAVQSPPHVGFFVGHISDASMFLEDWFKALNEAIGCNHKSRNLSNFLENARRCESYNAFAHKNGVNCGYIYCTVDRAYYKKFTAKHGTENL